ncbi:MAG: hypothetical protein IJL75_03865, partial [Eubacterium sp.]|nr:hypothetical protein [Eubacterium sp.]
MIIPDQLALGFNIAAVLLCIMNIVYMHIQGYTDKTNNRVFIALLYILAVNSAASIMEGLTELDKLGSSVLADVHYVSTFMYFLTHTSLAPLFYFYVSSVIGRSVRENTREAIVKAIPFFITEILVIINPFTHFVYYIDSNQDFQRNWGEALIYGAAAFYMLLMMFSILFSWKVLTKKRKTTIVFCFFMVLV